MALQANATLFEHIVLSDETSCLTGACGFKGIYIGRLEILLVTVVLSSLLLLWRIWRFTVLPLLHPDQPKEFPYTVPVLGHGRAFFQDSNGLLARARSYFGSGEPFALTAFGMTFYVVTQVKQSVEVYRNSDTLSFEDFVQGLMRSNGNDEDVIQAVYTALPADKAGFPNPRGESLGVLAQAMHAHQLLPGDNLVVLQGEVRKWLDQHVNIADIRASPSARSPGGFGSVEVSLYQWCSEYFIQMGQDVYFGEALAKIDPQLPSTFLVFDELIWKMLYQYPHMLSADMTTPRREVIASLERYFEVPQIKRSDGAAWLINAMEDEMRALGVEGRNLAVVVFHLYLAINTNTRKTAFWVLAYLLYNPELLAAYRQETALAFRGAELVDPFMIQDAAVCPKVGAIWHETLRMSGWAASVRLITEDTVIGNKSMRKGNRVMVPHRLLHFDEDIFGEATHEFRINRWLDNKDLARSPSFRPFGAGKTRCSGRFLARFSVTTFVATLLRRFDVELVGKPDFPRADQGRPVLGTMSIMEGDDFKVRLTPRTVFE